MYYRILLSTVLYILTKDSGRRLGIGVELISFLSIGIVQRALTHSTGLQKMAGKPRHGQSASRTYSSWASMRDRCLNANATKYPVYGGSDIRICKRWNRFENFLQDLGARPKGKSLDRFPDKDGNYTPNNCRWATAHEQNLNRRKYTKKPKLLCKRGHLLIQGPVQKECRICHNETVKRYRERIKNA